MWFIYVGAGLVLVTITGIYTRRRIAGALAHFGVRARRVRIVRWLIAWLLFGFPILMIVSITISLMLGRATLPRFDGVIASWLLGFPFAWAVLVVVQSVPWLVATDLLHLIVRRRRDAAAAARVRAVGVLGIIAVFGVYTPLRVVAERGDLRVRHHRVGSSPTPATPPFRIAFIADIQQDVHTDAERAREVYAIVNASQPDVVLSGGDWINSGPDHVAAAAATAAELKSRLGTFSVRGDHEHFAYVDRERSVTEVEQAMRSHGIAMVNNEVRWFTHHGKRVAVVFLNYNYIAKVDRATITSLVASVAGADYAIAVTHQLDASLTPLLAGKVDLILGAHTHGGQVNPIVGVTHVKLARLETELIDGRYEHAGTTIIITAGVGYSIIPFRYASPGAIELIELAL
ncbi:MAG: metallophosphoesterase [Deltaproteobacteria bacterium]|nr:metallophosphoesterase [Deltaproteobacteria bacterium]